MEVQTTLHRLSTKRLSTDFTEYEWLSTDFSEYNWLSTDFPE